MRSTRSPREINAVAVAVALALALVVALSALVVVGVVSVVVVVAAAATTGAVAGIFVSVDDNRIDGLRRAVAGVLASDRRRRDIAGPAIRSAGMLLPARVREEYAEERQRWLADMRDLGEPWYSRLFEVLSIWFKAPVLAVTLRLGRSWIVD